MKIQRLLPELIFRRLFALLPVALVFIAVTACGDRTSSGKSSAENKNAAANQDEYYDNGVSQAVPALILSPKFPRPGQAFRILAVGDKSILKSKITSPAITLESLGSRSGEGLPFWRIETFHGLPEGKYRITLQNGSSNMHLDIQVTSQSVSASGSGVWQAEKSWDAASEELYAAWVNALFYEADERSSWKALDEVTQKQGAEFSIQPSFVKRRRACRQKQGADATGLCR